MSQGNSVKPVKHFIFRSLPLFCTLATDDEAVLLAADTVLVNASETPSLTETVEGSLMLAEVEGTSPDAMSAPPVTSETLSLIRGKGLGTVPAKI